MEDELEPIVIGMLLTSKSGPLTEQPGAAEVAWNSLSTATMHARFPCTS